MVEDLVDDGLEGHQRACVQHHVENMLLVHNTIARLTSNI